MKHEKLFWNIKLKTNQKAFVNVTMRWNRNPEIIEHHYIVPI